MEISLAIPNYNGGDYLKSTLDSISADQFEDLYVLDDNSSDNSKKIVKENFSDFEFIQGGNNLGPAGNRNRILKQEYGDIILFLDADMKLKTENIKEKNKNIFESNEELGIIGGKIITLENDQMFWNYGHELHPVKDAKGEVILKQAQEQSKIGNQEKVDELREKYKDINLNLEIRFGKDKQREVDWVSEAFLFIRSDIFEEANGFDSNMTYHADQDLAKRVRQLDYKVKYTPNLKAKHLDMDTFGENREKQIKEKVFYFFSKHWEMSRKVFDQLYSW